jgi:hypothetical protein
MAFLSMGESRWRMLRRGLKKKKFRYDDARNMSRNDQIHFDWLISAGFIKEAGDGYFTVTDRGREAADLGFYEV